MSAEHAREKIKLNLDDLRVESFDAAADEFAIGGTVRGHATQDTECQQYTCAETEQQNCGETWASGCTVGSQCTEGDTCGGSGCPTYAGETCQLTICGPIMC